MKNELHFNTPRDVARIAGYAIWDCRVSLLPILTRFDVIEILKTHSAHITTKSQWDSALLRELDEEELAQLMEVLDNIARNEPHSLRRKRTPSSTVYLASDASGGEEGSPNIGGGVWLRSGDWEDCESTWFEYPEDIKTQPIHVKELYADYRTLLKWCKKGEQSSPWTTPPRDRQYDI